MADGRWVMTEDELNRTVCGFDNEKRADMNDLPNTGKHVPVDDRTGKAEHICALCGSADLITGLGGFGEGYGYKSARCKTCGGITEFVYKDDAGKFFR